MTELMSPVDQVGVKGGSSGLWELTACGKLLTLSSSKLKQMAQNAKVNITGLTEKREVSSRPGLGQSRPSRGLTTSSTFRCRSPRHSSPPGPRKCRPSRASGPARWTI